jgi:transcriptional regulator of acetoin/glycerol metabolism
VHAAHVGCSRQDVDDETMLIAVDGKPSTNTCEIASHIGIPRSTVWRMLHENQMHP